MIGVIVVIEVIEVIGVIGVFGENGRKGEREKGEGRREGSSTLYIFFGDAVNYCVPHVHCDT